MDIQSLLKFQWRKSDTVWAEFFSENILTLASVLMRVENVSPWGGVYCKYILCQLFLLGDENLYLRLRHYRNYQSHRRKMVFWVILTYLHGISKTSSLFHRWWSTKNIQRLVNIIILINFSIKVNRNPYQQRTLEKRQFLWKNGKLYFWWNILWP